MYALQGYLEDSKTRDCDDIKKMKHEEIEKRIIGPNNPAKIILHSNTPYLSEMKLLKQKILKKHSKKLIILEEAWENYDSIFVTETAKHLLDNSYAKYHILPVSMQNYIIGFECGGKKFPLILAHTDNNKYIVDQYIRLPNEAHAYQFELEVDANNFLSPQHT
uniref:Uncharacterized protein n=1 Tax=Panagrolaimus davidi TaxID=227884 RepID=A0A914Q773_9BILA